MAYKKIKTKKSINAMDHFNRNGFMKKPFIISIVTVLAIALLVILILYAPREGVVGKATHAFTSGQYNYDVVDGSKGVKFEYVNYYASVGDNVDLILMMTSDEEIGTIDFEVFVDGVQDIEQQKLIYRNDNCYIEDEAKFVTANCAFELLGGHFDNLGYRSVSDATWSAVSGTTPTFGDNVKVLKIPFKVGEDNLPGDQIIVNLNNVVMRTPADVGLSYSIGDISAKILIISPCQDQDNDGYGQQGTDLRACPNFGNEQGTLNFDCNDNDNTVNPGATESCNGVDDNCNALVDDALTHESNDNLKGVCAGYKVCAEVEGIWGMYDSYLIDPFERVAQSEYYTSYDGINQYDLYSEEVCDFYDNNCDGQINEGLDCNFGTGSPDVGIFASEVPGNVWFEISSLDDNTPKDVVQRIATLDSLLHNQIFSSFSVNCGGVGEAYCYAEKIVDDLNIYYCKDNKYYFNQPSNPDVYYYITADSNLQRFASKEDLVNAIGVTC